jgi:hypothetical protein
MFSKKMLPLIVAGAALPLLSGGALAQEVSPAQMELAKQLIASGNFGDQVLKVIGPQIKADLAAQYAKAGKPADEKVIDDFVAQVTEILRPKLAASVEEAVPEVAKVFTEGELKALVAFAGTQDGKAALDKFPSYVGAVVQKLGPAMQKEAPAALRQVSESFKAKGVELPLPQQQ